MIIEKWKQSQSYVIGLDHRNRQSVCQDRTYYQKGNGVHVIALADGAGSKQRSEVGAEIVTKKICEVLAQDFYKYYMMCEKRGREDYEYLKNIKNFKKEIVEILVSELKTYALNENISYDDLSSTLQFCAISQNKYIIGHLGDGVIGGLFSEGESLTVKTLSAPHNGGAPNITFFTTDIDASDNLRITAGEFTNMRGIILMSDGPQEVMYHKDTGLNDNVIKIFDNFKQINSYDYNLILDKFLLEKISHYSYDDLSLNILFLETVPSDESNPYFRNMFSDIKSKEQIIRKSQYCVLLDPTKKVTYTDFISIDDIRSYLKWT